MTVASSRPRFLDWEHGVTWVSPEPTSLERASQALVADGKVWLVDPVAGAGLEERIRALGEPAGVIQLLDRHERDCEALARSFGVTVHRLPFEGIPGSPFELVPVRRRRWWQEAALWWPAAGVLVFGDAVGTAQYYLAPGERLAVHPLLRLALPAALRELSRSLSAHHVLSGHGEGIHGDEAGAALAEALATARGRILHYALGLRRRGR